MRVRRGQKLKTAGRFSPHVAASKDSVTKFMTSNSESWLARFPKGRRAFLNESCVGAPPSAEPARRAEHAGPLPWMPLP